MERIQSYLQDDETVLWMGKPETFLMEIFKSFYFIAIISFTYFYLIVSGMIINEPTFFLIGSICYIISILIGGYILIEGLLIVNSTRFFITSKRIAIYKKYLHEMNTFKIPRKDIEIKPNLILVSNERIEKIEIVKKVLNFSTYIFHIRELAELKTQIKFNLIKDDLILNKIISEKFDRS